MGFQHDLVQPATGREGGKTLGPSDAVQQASREVVKGTLDGSQFHASEISAKCPSKYNSRPDGPAATLCTRGDKSL